MSKGYFIVLEGTEGSGKSTQREFIGEWFRDKGFNVTFTREPGGTPMAEEVRELILRPRDEPVSGKVETLLFFAARQQHLDQVIMPKLAQGNIVICDRFIDSTYAYQASGRGLSREEIDKLTDYVLGDFRPDMTFLMLIDAEVGIKRAAARGRLDRIERAGSDFFARVGLAFLGQMERDPARYTMIDCDKTIDEVSQGFIPHLEKIAAKLRSPAQESEHVSTD